MEAGVLIKLMREPLEPCVASAWLLEDRAAGIGGVDLFMGSTRPEADAENGNLVALDYDAYEEMAIAKIRELIAVVKQRWAAIRVVVLHRLGRVAVGELSVIIGVGCAHRDEAFLACRYLIDELKRVVPIWKKEIYERGTRWQGQGN